MTNFQVNDFVNSDQYGLGTVIEVNSDSSVRVEFPNGLRPVYWQDGKEYNPMNERDYITKPTLRELEVIQNSLSCQDEGYVKNYLMAENSAGQKAFYCIPTDGGKHYREVKETDNYFRRVELIPPPTAQLWKGHGYSGGHTSQSHWDTYQQVDEMFRLICAGFIVLDETTEGHNCGYFPKVSYWNV